MILSTDLVAALGWALLDFLWQGLLIGAVAALALLALRNARPQARYAVACIALACCLALPLASVLGSLAKREVVTSASGVGPIASALAIERAPRVLAVAGNWHPSVEAQLPALVAAWSAGALLLALRLLFGCRWVEHLRASGRLPAAHWQGRCDELAVHVGLAAPVPLRVCDRIDSPVAAGWWRPVVLVPAALFAGMPAALLEALIAHELAHVRRRDYLVNLMQGAVEALLFYHPVVWWLSRQLRVEREHIADDLAARAIGDPRPLALALQALERFQSDSRLPGPARLPRAPGLVPAAHGGNLMSRIKRLLRPDHQRPDWKLALPLAGLAAFALTVHAQGAGTPAVPAAPPTASAPAVRASVAVTPNAAVTPKVAVKPIAAVTPRVAVTPVVAAVPTVAVSSSARSGPRQPYAMVRAGQDGMMLSGDLDDVAEVKRARQHLHGDFLWFRRGGAGYVIQDAALLARARQAWGPAEQHGARMQALADQMQPHSQRMEALGRQMERYGQHGQPHAKEMEALGRKMEPLARQQQELAAKIEKLALARVDEVAGAGIEAAMHEAQAKMDRLQVDMEAVSRAMERHGRLMQEAHAPMEQLGKQMEAAGRPMEELGRKLEVLGKQQEALSRAADAEVVRVIDEAVRAGKAAPVHEFAR